MEQSTADLLGSVAALRWSRPDLTGALAEHLQEMAAGTGDRDLWLAAAGWRVYATTAIGDGRESAAEVLEGMDRWGAAVLEHRAAHRLRVELAVVAAEGGRVDVARALLRPMSTVSDPALAADAALALARCALDDDPDEVDAALRSAEEAWNRVTGPRASIGAAAVALVGAAAQRRRGRPEAAIARAVDGLALLDRARGLPSAPTPSGHLAAALAAEWITSLIDAGRLEQARDGCAPLRSRLTESARASRQLARLRLTVARATASAMHPDETVHALERAAQDAAASNAPDLESVCRSALGELHEAAGRLEAALESIRLGVVADRRHQARTARIRAAFGSAADHWQEVDASPRPAARELPVPLNRSGAHRKAPSPDTGISAAQDTGPGDTATRHIGPGDTATGDTGPGDTAAQFFGAGPLPRPATALAFGGHPERDRPAAAQPGPSSDGSGVDTSIMQVVAPPGGGDTGPRPPAESVDPWTSGRWSGQDGEPRNRTDPVPAAAAGAGAGRAGNAAPETEPGPTTAADLTMRSATAGPYGPEGAPDAGADTWLAGALADLDRIWGTTASITEGPEPPGPEAEGCVVVLDLVREGHRLPFAMAAPVVRRLAVRLAERLPPGSRLRDEGSESVSVVLPGLTRASASDWTRQVVPDLVDGLNPGDVTPGSLLRAAVHDADGADGAQILQRLDGPRLRGDRRVSAPGTVPDPDAGGPALPDHPGVGTVSRIVGAASSRSPRSGTASTGSGSAGPGNNGAGSRRIANGSSAAGGARHLAPHGRRAATDRDAAAGDDPHGRHVTTNGVPPGHDSSGARHAARPTGDERPSPRGPDAAEPDAAEVGATGGEPGPGGTSTPLWGERPLWGNRPHAMPLRDERDGDRGGTRSEADDPVADPRRDSRPDTASGTSDAPSPQPRRMERTSGAGSPMAERPAAADPARDGAGADTDTHTGADTHTDTDTHTHTDTHTDTDGTSPPDRPAGSSPASRRVGNHAEPDWSEPANGPGADVGSGARASRPRREDEAGERRPFLPDGLIVRPGSGGRRHRRDPDGEPDVAPPAGPVVEGAVGEEGASGPGPTVSDGSTSGSAAPDAATGGGGPGDTADGLGLADLLAGALAAYRSI